MEINNTLSSQYRLLENKRVELEPRDGTEVHRNFDGFLFTLGIMLCVMVVINCIKQFNRIRCKENNQQESHEAMPQLS